MTILTTQPKERQPRVEFPLARVRGDFPILQEKIHNKPLVYLDNAASTQKPRQVIDSLRDYYEHCHANVHRAVHVLSERATEAYEEARIHVQKFLNAPCLREIIFTRGTTEGINLVAQSFGRMNVHAGDEIIITELEHHSNIVPWQVVCWEKGANLRVVPINDRGEVRLDELEKMFNPSTKLLAVSHVSNALGTINPVKEMATLAHQAGVPILVDGAQAVPHLPVDVQDLDCDFYVLSGHKVFGPTGIGALFGKPQHLELMPPYQTGGDMISYVSFEKTAWNELPNKFEAGTPNIAGAIGLGAAVEYVQEIGRGAIAEHEHRLLVHAMDRLQAIPGVRLIGTAPNKASVVSFVVEDPPISGLDLGTRLDLEGIAVRTGHHCCQPLMAKLGIEGTVRASFALYNTLEEIDFFADTLERIVAAARPRPIAVGSMNPIFPAASAPSPREAAEELADTFEFLDDWTQRYQHILELGEKLPPMPEAWKTEENLVRGCQSTVHLQARTNPDQPQIVEFLADSNADIVRGLIAVLQKLFSGQKAQDIVNFNVDEFMRRIGLDKNLSMGRRNGLAEMIARIRQFAARQIH